MERTEPPPGVVCDAGPLIHLDELDSLDLLCDFASVLVPRSVWGEVMRHRPRALETGVAAEALHLRVHGTIGVLLRAVRLGRRTRDQAIQTLEGLRDRASLHVRPALIAQVVQRLRSAD